MSTCLMAPPPSLCLLHHALARVRSGACLSMAFGESLLEDLVMSEVTLPRVGKRLRLLVVLARISRATLVIAAGCVRDHPRLCVPLHVPPSPGAPVDRRPAHPLAALPWSRRYLPRPRPWPQCPPPNPARCPHSRCSIPRTTAT